MRDDAEGHELALARARPPIGRLLKAARIANHMIRRRDHQRRVGIDLQRLERGQRHRRGGVAAGGLEQNGAAGMPSARSCSATVKRCASLHTTMGGRRRRSRQPQRRCPAAWFACW
jgi:hypothetical protein